MPSSSRTENTIRNIIFSLLSLLVPVFLVMVQRAVFVRVLPVEYLGVNNLFADIFAMLSLFEMGAGSAIAYYFYQPLATGDFGKVRSLTKLYRTIYWTIGLIVVLVGLSLTPFLPHLVKSKQLVPHFQLIYWLQLFTTAFSYLSGDQRSLFVADQKAYIMSKNDLFFRLLLTFLQTLYLWIAREYIGFMVIGLMVIGLQNITIIIMGKRHYPQAQGQADPIPKEEKDHIFSRVKAFMMHKIGGVIYNGTDNLLISKLVGLSALGIYANYESLKIFVGLFQNQIFAAMVPSIGNISEEDSGNQLHALFRKIFYLNFIVTAFCSFSLYFLMTPFIKVWLGDGFVIEPMVVVWIVIAFYLGGIRQSAVSFTLARGLFYQTRFKPLIESSLNILISIIMGQTFGVAGIMMGSATSIALTMWMDPYYLYKLVFKRPLKNYLFSHLKLGTWFIVSIYGFQHLVKVFGIRQLSFPLYALVVIFFALLTALLPIIFTDEWVYYKELSCGILTKIKKRFKEN